MSTIQASGCAQSVTLVTGGAGYIWGSGSPMREFLHVDDMAAACVHVLELPAQLYRTHTQPMLSHVNVGTGMYRG